MFRVMTVIFALMIAPGAAMACNPNGSNPLCDPDECSGFNICDEQDR